MTHAHFQIDILLFEISERFSWNTKEVLHESLDQEGLQQSKEYKK